MALYTKLSWMNMPRKKELAVLLIGTYGINNLGNRRDWHRNSVPICPDQQKLLAN